MTKVDIIETVILAVLCYLIPTIFCLWDARMEIVNFFKHKEMKCALQIIGLCMTPLLNAMWMVFIVSDWMYEHFEK